MDMFAGLNLDQKLSEFQTNTNNAMKNVNSATLTPADTTAKNIKEGVAKKTPRDTSVKNTVSEYKNTVVDQLDSLVGMMTGGLLKTTDITKAVRVGRDGVTFSDDAIVSAIGSSLGYPVNGKTGVMRRIASGVTSEFKRITGVNIGGLLQTNGETFSVRKNWRGQVGQQVLRMVGDTIGIDEFLDYSVKGAIYNNILYSAVGYGMSDSYGKLYGAYPSGFSALRRDAVIVAMETAIHNGDIVSLNVLLGLLETEGRQVMISKYPNFIELLFSNFKFDDDVFPENYPELLATLKQVLVGLLGEFWYLKQTQFGKVYNMALLQKVSKDMKTLLLGWPEILPLVATAGMFKERSALTELKNTFKYAAQFD